MNNLKKYIELKKEEKKIKEQLAELQGILLGEVNEATEIDGYTINKATRINFKLKKDINTDEIIDKFPEATTIKIDTKILSKTPEAKDYLDIEEKEYLIVKQSK